jgi:hypothetical protein
MRRYGISDEAVREMTARQNNACAICGVTNVLLHVDHCHSDNKVRGMLCAACNHGLGLFHDDLVLLKKAREYLLMWDDSTVQVVKNTGERADGKTDVVTDGIGGFVCGEG